MNDAFFEHFNESPYNRMLGITLVERRPGYGKIVLRKTPDTPQGIGGSVHGGILASMVDIAMLVAVFSDLTGDDKPAGTADLTISYLRQAHGENIYAEANVIKKGRQLCMVEVSITDDEGRLCCRGKVLYVFRAG